MQDLPKSQPVTYTVKVVISRKHNITERFLVLLLQTTNRK